MMSMLTGMLLKMIDEYQGSSDQFSLIMKEAFSLSWYLQGGSLWPKDFTSHVAREANVSSNMVGAWINGAMTPAKESDRRAILAFVRSWFSPS